MKPAINSQILSNLYKLTCQPGQQQCVLEIKFSKEKDRHVLNQFKLMYHIDNKNPIETVTGFKAEPDFTLLQDLLY